MKKTMLFSSALVALAMLASCQKEEFIETPATAAGVTEFTATIESTKTTIATDGKVTWTAGDEITVTDAASKSAVYVATSSGRSTTFTLKQDQTAVGAGPYKATYGDVTKQKYSANGANCPLTAQSSTTNFTFSSLYAVLKITAKSSGEEEIKTVVVTYGGKGFSLDCGEGVKLTSAGVDFYVAIEPASKDALLSVTFYNTAEKMATRSRKNKITLAAKALLSVTFDSFTWENLTSTFKAVHNTTDGSLTFYYDNSLHVGEGVLFDNLTIKATSAADWGYDGVRSKIEKVVITEPVKNYKDLTSTAYMFQNMTAASSISGAEHLDVSKVTDMSFMFFAFGFYSKSLTAIPNVTNWQTDNVTNMNSLFYCYGNGSGSLAEVPDVSKWNTAKVKNMSNMFNQYGKSSMVLTKVPIVNGNNWDTGEVTDMSGMFQSYGYTSESLAEVPDVSKWNTAKVEDMSKMFYGYAYYSKVLTIVPVVNGSNWDTKAVKNMSSMFQDYGYTSTDLKDVPQVGNWNTEIVTKMGSMFYKYGYSSGSLAGVPDVSKWNTAKVEDMSYMFNSFAYKSTALTTVPKVDGSNWKTENLEKIGYMFQYYGNGAENIRCELDLSGWDLAKLSEGSSVFDFTPTVFYVKIPATTGGKSNTDEDWFYGTGSNSIKPAFSDKGKPTRHNFNQTNPAN